MSVAYRFLPLGSCGAEWERCYCRWDLLFICPYELSVNSDDCYPTRCIYKTWYSVLAVYTETFKIKSSYPDFFQ